jgi:RNA polymerase sigma factor (sigma-70 family)
MADAKRSDKDWADIYHRCQEGHRNAAWDEVWIYACRLASGGKRYYLGDDAHDVAQRACLKLMKSVSNDAVEVPAAFGTFIYRVVVNEAKDCLERKQKEAEILCEISDPERWAASNGDSADLQRTQAPRPVIEKLMRSLKDKDCAKVLAVYIPYKLKEGPCRSYAEMQKALVMPRGTISTHVRRCFKAMRKLSFFRQIEGEWV